MNITLKNLKKTYSGAGGTVTAVNGISLTIPSNKIFGIIGKSGAGKSSLVRLISMLEPCDSGELYYDDERVDNIGKKELIERRRKIGMIFQNFALFSSRTAAKNIAYPLEICGTPKKEIDMRVKEMLRLVGLEDKADSPVSALSGGQKQRIAIARALASKPDVLFCDEATSALDPQTTRSILELIRDIQKKMNLTVVMITHQMEVVRDACDEVAVVHQGKIVEQGPVDQVFTELKSDITKEFFSHMQTNETVVKWTKNQPAYEIRFHEDAPERPCLSQTVKKFNVEFNIHSAGTQVVKDKKIGMMTADIIGDEKDVEAAIAYLSEINVEVKKI